jgi:hypothetical protein
LWNTSISVKKKLWQEIAAKGEINIIIVVNGSRHYNGHCILLAPHRDAMELEDPEHAKNIV